MSDFISIPKKKGWWERHCDREKKRDAQREEETRAEKVEQAYLDIADYATPEERADHAVIDIDQCALPKQAIEAARLAITRSSTDGGTGPKLDSGYVGQRLLPALLRIEEELEGKYGEIKVYADVSALPDNAGNAADKA